MKIFNRIINIVSSKYRIIPEEFEGVTFNIDDIIRDNSDDELNKLIDDLNKNKKAANATSNEGFTKNNLLHYYDVLGVPIDSSVEEIANAYKKKLKSIHPDKHADSTLQEKKIFEKNTADIIEAYNLIKQSINMNNKNENQ